MLFLGDKVEDKTQGIGTVIECDFAAGIYRIQFPSGVFCLKQEDGGAAYEAVKPKAVTFRSGVSTGARSANNGFSKEDRQVFLATISGMTDITEYPMLSYLQTDALFRIETWAGVQPKGWIVGTPPGDGYESLMKVTGWISYYKGRYSFAARDLVAIAAYHDAMRKRVSILFGKGRSYSLVRNKTHLEYFGKKMGIKAHEFPWYESDRLRAQQNAA
jgi:hypothetical protein